MAKPMINIPSTANAVTPPAFEYGEDYAFYDARMKRPPDYYQKILATATKTIQIWETHSNPEVDWKVFSEVKCPQVDITILTICDKNLSDESAVRLLADNIVNNLNNAVKACVLTIFAFHRSCIYNDLTWHDRFLVIDDTDYYLVGPSMNNQVGSDTSFGIHYLSKTSDRDLLKKKLDSFLPLTGSSKLRIQVTRKRPSNGK